MGSAEVVVENVANRSLRKRDEKKAKAKDPNHRVHKKREKSVIEKLFSSKEGRQFLHIHEILGFSCLFSFIYRFSGIGGAADGHFGPGYGTLFFIAHHWLLNASAFIFDIPQRRIRDGGYRIWPEYRIHSLVFASRALAFIFLIWWEQIHGIRVNSRDCYYLVDLIIVLATCAFADLGSYLQREYRSNTVRDATFSDPFENHFASEMQLMLTAFCIVGYRRYTLHLLALFNIQVNSFLMTLRRKDIAPQFVLTGIYSLMLLISAVAILCDDEYSRRTAVASTVGCIACLLRMGPLRCNKYLLWTGLYLAFNYLRTNHVISMYNNWTWLNSFCLLNLATTMMGVYKRSKAPKQTRNPVVGFLVYATHIALYAFLAYANCDFN